MRSLVWVMPTAGRYNPALSSPSASARGNIPSLFLVVGVGRQWAREAGESAAPLTVGCGIAGPKLAKSLFHDSLT